MHSLFLSNAFQRALLWKFSKNPSQIHPVWGVFSSLLSRENERTLTAEQGNLRVFTAPGTGAAFLPVWSVWTAPGPRWRRCWTLAGRRSGRPRRSGGSPAGRCRCSARPAPSAHWSGSWGQEKPWLKTPPASPNHAAFVLFNVFSISCRFGVCLVVGIKSDFQRKWILL